MGPLLPIVVALCTSLALAGPGPGVDGSPPAGGNAKPPAAPGRSPTPEEELLALNRASPPVGYVFLLESSVELHASTDALRESIAALVESVPAGDVIEVISFHVRPYEAVPATTVTEENRVSLAASIRALEMQSGTDRDLGAGLNHLAGELVRPSAPGFQHVFVASSFCHTPSFGSPWSSGGSGCSPIRNQSAIGAQLTRLNDQGRLSTHLFPLAVPSLPVDAGGLDTAVRELGGEITIDSAETWLRNWHLNLPVERIEPLIAWDARNADIALSVIRAPTSEDPVATLSVRTTSELLGMRLDRIRVAGAAGAVESTAMLAPAAELRVPVDIPPGPLSFFPRTDNVDVDLVLTADGQLSPEPILRGYGLDGARPALTARVKVGVTRHYGLSTGRGAATLLGIFVVSGLGAVYARGKLMPLRLGGAVWWRRRGGEKVVLDVSERSEAALVVGADGQVRLGKPDEATVILRVRRPLWRMYGEVVVRAAGVELNGRPVPPGVRSVVPGAAGIRIGDTRISWE